MKKKQGARRWIPLMLVLVGALVLSACGGAAQGLGVAPVAVNAAVSQPSSWAAESVDNAVELGLVPTSLRGAYQQPTTRAEFAAFAVALYESVTGRAIAERMTFNDTDDLNVQKMGGLGVVSGVGNGNFNPNGTLTREQAAVMLSRLAEAMGHPLENAPATFADNAEIASWANVAVAQMQANGIMSGTGNNMFSPRAHYTREQSIVTVLRLREVLMAERGQADLPDLPITTPTPTPPVARREFNMNDPNVRAFPILATAQSVEELQHGTRIYSPRTVAGQRVDYIYTWQSAAERTAHIHDDHPDSLVDGMTVYEWRFRAIFAWVDNYLTTIGWDPSEHTDYANTQVIRWIIEDGLLEEFIGVWRSGFSFGAIDGRGDCVPISEAVHFLMIAMDFEMFRQVSTIVNIAHSTNAYWDSTTNTIRFVDGNLSFGVWNLFVDEIYARNFTLR